MSPSPYKRNRQVVILARSPNQKAEKARELYKGGMKLVEIASQLECSAATIRTWKNRYKWDADESETFQKKNETKRNVSKSNASKKQSEETAVADEVRQVIQNTNLTDKQQLFCIHYIRCFNATKAYQKAYGVDYATAASIGYRLLEKDGVKQEIHRLKQDRLNREFLSESDVFQKYMDIAFADVTDFVEFGNEDVDVIPDTGERKTITVSYVNIKNDADVDGTIISEVSKGKDGVKVKLADRMKALQWLTDHMDLATEKQKAEIALLKAKVQTDDGEEIADDGFLDALNGTAAEDWGDEEN
jgi:phage terminase small subunit|nr:MAG TPA: Terminase small subunit [Caudoviricetes sp.]DAR22426.1 MAG TPA: Terminase small subunit [Caudoviricetes sp.]